MLFDEANSILDMACGKLEGSIIIWKEERRREERR